MHDRAHPIEVPDGPRYIRIEHPTVGALAFRLPIFAVAADLYRLIDVGQLRALGELAKENPLEGSAALADQSNALGALVGLLWHHPTRGLDAVYTGDLLAYGAEVTDELVEEGWGLVTLLTVCVTLYNEVRDFLLGIDRAVALADPPEGAAPSTGT